jgi:hypothetical protein
MGLTGGGAAPERHAAGCHRDEHCRCHAVGKGGPVQAEVRGCHPGDHDRDAEPEEVDDENGGDEPGALRGSGQRDHDAVGAKHSEPETHAGQRGAGQESGGRGRGDRGEGHREAGEQDQAAGEHRRARGEPAERRRGHGRDPGEQEGHQAAP